MYAKKKVRDKTGQSTKRSFENTEEIIYVVTKILNNVKIEQVQMKQGFYKKEKVRGKEDFLEREQEENYEW